MYKIALAVVLIFGLLSFTGCTQSDREVPLDIQKSLVIPTAEEDEKAIAQILHQQILLYENGCDGFAYLNVNESNEEYLAGFAIMHCQNNNIPYGADSDRQSLIRLATKEYFDITFDQDQYFSDVEYRNKISISPIETTIDSDTATVVVQKFLYQEELLNSKYTFKKAEMPESFEGTIFEQLAYKDCIWKIVEVEVLENPVISDVVEISNAEQLIKFSMDVNARIPEAVSGKFIVTNDIDLTGNTAFTAIGVYNDNERWDSAALNLRTPMGFNGTFDGGGHTISGFALNECTEALGFFRVINDDAQIKNLNLEGSVVNDYVETQNSCTGGFAGLISASAKIENCSFTGSVEGKSYVGGFVGTLNSTNYYVDADKEASKENISGLITDCTTNTKVNAAYYAGGFAGSVFSGLVEKCTANGQVIIDPKYGGIPMSIGGFCGEANSTIESCHSNVKVTHFVDGANHMGNFVGNLGSKNIVNCTIKSDVVNPEWFMVGMKSYRNTEADIRMVD